MQDNSYVIFTQRGLQLMSQTKHKGLEIHKRRNDISVSGVRRPAFGIRLSSIRDRIYMIMLPEVSWFRVVLKDTDGCRGAYLGGVGSIASG